MLGRPVHRIVAALAHDGLDLTEGALAGVFAACSDLLAPLADKISERNAAGGHLHVDETPLAGRSQRGQRQPHRWWCWVFLGPDTTVFTIAVAEGPGRPARPEPRRPDRRAARCAARGPALLQSSDFYTVYQSLGRLDGADNLWCRAHIRRYFVRAGDAHPDLQAWTAAWLERIGTLYRAHSALAAAAPTSPDNARAAEQFDAARAAIDTERRARAATAHLMHPTAVKVLATLHREWDGLVRHREFPSCRWTATARSARCAVRWWAARTSTAQAGKPPPSWPARSLDDHHRRRRTRRPQPAGTL